MSLTISNLFTDPPSVPEVNGQLACRSQLCNVLILRECVSLRAVAEPCYIFQCLLTQNEEIILTPTSGAAFANSARHV